MSLWDRGEQVKEEVLSFSAGEEYRLDRRLVPFDCRASRAHVRMLGKIGALEEGDVASLVSGLERIEELHAQGEFEIAREQEDCHTAIEEWLTREVGEAGKKIHLGRSRNDQVLAALRLYEKSSLVRLDELLATLATALAGRAEDVGSVVFPGYTHLRRAMPTTIGTWLGAFVAAIDDDRRQLEALRDLIDQSPLGTGAGYGIPVFDLDRETTAQEMGFSRVLSNPIYAQMTRGKFESGIAHHLSQVMLTSNRLATDLLLFSTVEFGFVALPEAFCTGSSIMPQKHNPDVLELVRGHYHVVNAAELEIKGLVGNLMSGYQRDLGLTKAPLFRALDVTFACLKMMAQLVPGLIVDEQACQGAMTEELYATEEALLLVRGGMAYRDAYREIAERYAKKLDS
jgi:argininosuccinate lyase